MYVLLPVPRISDKSVCPQLLDERKSQSCASTTMKANAEKRSQRGLRSSIALAAKLCLMLLILPAASSMRAATVAPASLSWASVSVGLKGGPKPVTLTNNGRDTTVNFLVDLNPNVFTKTVELVLTIELDYFMYQDPPVITAL